MVKMTVIEIGAYASGILAIVSVLRQGWGLINHVQRLILTLEHMEQAMKDQMTINQTTQNMMSLLEERLESLEMVLVEQLKGADVHAFA